MSGGLGERMIRLLDWCWPFPLGIIAATLVTVMGMGLWLAIRSPQPSPAGRSLGQATPAEGSATVPGTLPLPAQDPAAALPDPTPAQMPPSLPTPTGAMTPAPAAALAKPQVAKPPVQPRRVAAQLSAKQKAEFADRLTIGQFLMDRKEYSAAIKEFQAAFAIDPTSREAQAAIQEAREAGKN